MTDYIMWVEIESEYPKSWEALNTHLTPKYYGENLAPDWMRISVEDGNELIYGYDVELVYNVRSLYDFFDKQNIVIDIETGQDKGEWGYTIWDKDGLLANKHHLNNRTETETHAFIKAFELLEKKL